MGLTLKNTNNNSGRLVLRNTGGAAGRVHMYLNQTSPFAFLLDEYPNAAAAWSLRKLRAAYTGACIRVRRSSDNAETDIGFVNNVLDTEDLLAFVGSGNDGLITTWYGQDTVGIDLSQTTLTRQPKIVNNGTLVTDGGSPAINFPDVGQIDTNLNASGLPTFTGFYSVIAVSRYSSLNERRILISDFVPNRFFFFPDNVSPNLASNNPSITQGYVNGVLENIQTRQQVRDAIGTSRFLLGVYNYELLLGSNSIELGRNEGPAGAFDFYQELIIYPTNQSANRTAIETNINNYYAIY